MSFDGHSDNLYPSAKESGIAITDVRVSNFRSLANIEVELNRTQLFRPDFSIRQPAG